MERPAPVGAEAAGLDAGEADVPGGFDLVGEGSGEDFDGSFGGVVDGEERDAVGRQICFSFLSRIGAQNLS